jgi:predicted kinase
MELLANITSWMSDLLGDEFYWLSGDHGTGKTTVAHSVASPFSYILGVRQLVRVTVFGLETSRPSFIRKL